MKMTENSYFWYSICLVSLGLITYGTYRIVKHKKVLTDTFNNSDIQRVNVISLKSVIEWIDNVINEELSPYKTLEVNVFPNLATKELLGDNLKLPRKDIDRCYIIIIHETGTQKVIKRKLVVSNHVAEDLTAIKEGKIFKFPVE